MTLGLRRRRHRHHEERITKAELSSRQETAVQQQIPNRWTLGSVPWRPAEGAVLVFVELSGLPAQGHGTLTPHSAERLRESVVTGQNGAVHLVGSFHG